MSGLEVMLDDLLKEDATKIVNLTTIHVHKGQEERLPLGRPIFDAFMGSLYFTLGKADKWDANSVTIEWADFNTFEADKALQAFLEEKGCKLKARIYVLRITKVISEGNQAAEAGLNAKCENDSC